MSIQIHTSGLTVNQLMNTYVNASDVLYLRDKNKTLKKRGNLLRTTSFNGNSCRVRILIKIIMVCVRAPLIIKALEYEFK